MKITILKERRAGEKRVAATPETVKKLVALGHEVSVEKGAGEASSYGDAGYVEAGGLVAKDMAAALKGAQVILKVQRPEEAELEAFPDGAILLAMMSAMQHKAEAASYNKKKVSTCALELVPRITRAQSMDVLSSQTNLAGYRSVIEASYAFDRVFPMMMTAAGTVPPARVLVVGAGVAGLQAIATAKRLGAIVSAFDVRAASKEQVESLGATFVSVESQETGDGQGGYAKEMSDDYKKRQADKMAEVVAKSDIVITTALIPGKPAPVLVTEEMVKNMKPGSVIVDLAVEAGGNCPLSKADKVVEKHGVKILGLGQLPSNVARDASALYARNIFNLLTLMHDKESGKLVLNQEDEIIKGILLTHAGKTIHALWQV